MNISSLQTDYLNLDISSDLGEIEREQTLFRQSAPFVEVLITLQKNVSKGLDRKRKNLVRLVLQKTDKRNRYLKNILDADMKITYLQNFQSHQKIMRNGKSKNFILKKVIVHATAAKITAPKIYMHLWHACLIIKNVLVEILDDSFQLTNWILDYG